MTHVPAPGNAAYLQELFGLEGQVAAVVGGAGRIGKVVSLALARAGAQVALVDVSLEAAALAESLAAQSERRVLAVAADAADRSRLEAAQRAISQALGPVGILVNCAQFRGSGFYSSRPEDYPREAWESVLSVNLTAVHLACQVFGGSMVERGAGRIINVASTYGLVSPDPRIYGESGVNSPVAYAASKAGVIQLTRYLAVHWRESGVRVNCLVPGGVFDGQDAQFVARYCERTPLARMASADDYCGAVLFLASKASEYMTGSVLVVDGGWTAW